MNNEGSKISVIVPVYNAGKFLRKCVESLTHQTYSDIEVILVEDGSTDDSAKLCDELSQEDERVKVIHKENAGASAARNTGILAATGKYIHFCDADDYIEPETYANIVGKMDDEEADCAFFGWYVDIIKGGKVDSVSQADNALDGVGGQDDIFRTILIICGSYGGKVGYGNYIWNKIYRRDKLKDENGDFILFDETVKIAEDGLWLVNAGVNWKKAVFDKKPYYHYLRNDESVMNTPGNYSRTRLASQKSHMEMLKILRAYNEDYYKIHRDACIDFFWLAAKSNPEQRDVEFFRQVITNIIAINDGECPENIAKDCLWHMKQTAINRRLLNRKLVKMAVDLVKKKDAKKRNKSKGR